MQSLKKLLQGVVVKQIIGPIHTSISQLCFDSRQATNDSCFIAIPGTQVDGHNYIAMAIAAGSKAIICEKLPNIPTNNDAITYVVVNSTTEVLAIMASNFYNNPSNYLKIVAVTGTNGKTTIVHLLYHIVTQMGYKAGMLSTICNKVADQIYPTSHTTPNALQLQQLLHLMYLAGCQYCFMEASSHAIVQHRLSSDMLTGVIFTNITPEHLDYHTSFKNYIQAKKSLFDHLSKQAFALINKDDKNSQIMIQNCHSKKFTFSLRESANFRAKILSNTLQGLELEIDNYQIWSQLRGAFNASNLLAAYATAQLLGLDSKESLIALSSIPPILGRMNSIAQNKIQHVFIDFAHTPDAIKQAIKSIRSMMSSKGRLITVMGCGGNRDKQNRIAIGSILSVYSDIAIFTSDNPRYEDPQDIINDMQQGVATASKSKVLHIIDRAMAIKTACFIATKQDIILVAGKGHQHYQEIQSKKHYFCDEEIIQKFFEPTT